ncbi:hypothetical protein ACH4FX_37960 [Streptomyces sp. NPDC018019]|uniref:hypothetical protein n=1 Tax=Streptomyces sp. NPDC018019 TaxID=3365030 RepID=UPI003787C330
MTASRVAAVSFTSTVWTSVVACVSEGRPVGAAEDAGAVSGVGTAIPTATTAAVAAPTGTFSGLGKTAFAVHAARLLAPGFPGGQFHLDLLGVDPKPTRPGDALARL